MLYSAQVLTFYSTPMLARLATALLLCSSVANADLYHFDPIHTRVSFAVDQGTLALVHGGFDRFQGQLSVDEQHPNNSQVCFTIDAASINTQSSIRDYYLRRPPFFDVSNYPTIAFKSTQVNFVDANHGHIEGDLTLLGITHKVSLNVQLSQVAANTQGQRVANFTATTRILRSDFGLASHVPLLGNEVPIFIEAMAISE